MSRENPPEPEEQLATQTEASVPDLAARATPVERPRIGSEGVATPIVVELGKRRRKQIKKLRNGEGPLVKEVADVIDQVRAELGDELNGKVLLPVVVVYRKKSRRARSTLRGPFTQS